MRIDQLGRDDARGLHVAPGLFVFLVALCTRLGTSLDGIRYATRQHGDRGVREEDFTGADWEEGVPLVFVGIEIHSG